MIRLFAIIVTLIAATLVAFGCAPGRGPYASPAQIERNPLEAQRLNARAAAILDELDAEPRIPPLAPGHDEQQLRSAEKLAAAESILREALDADLYCGPAHNNLGIVYLMQSSVKGGKLYEAASEFEWARKLMPGHPHPRVNLALTLERAGKIDDAIAACRAALESRPGHLPSIQCLARLQVKHRRADDRTNEYLSEIALRGEPRWSTWAQTMLNRTPPASSVIGPQR